MAGAALSAGRVETTMRQLGRIEECFATTARWLLAGILVAAGAGISSIAAGQEPENLESSEQSAEGGIQDAAQSEAVRRKGFLVQVPLPINAAVQEQVENTLRRIVEQAPEVREASGRPVVVLEFDTSNGRNGRGSRLGSCLDLSRFLISNDVSSVELVAYIPAPKGFLDATNPGDSAPKSELTGHAVLVALACNHLVMHRDAVIGQAGVDEPAIDDGLRNTYRQIAAKRLVFPVEVALSMLDPALSLYRVDVGDGKTVFVDRVALEQLEAEGKVVQSETLSEQGNLPLFDAPTLFDFQLLRHRVDSRRDIAQRFRLTPDSLEGDPTLGTSWKAAHVALKGEVDERQVSWIINALNQLDPKVNLILVSIESDMGNPTHALRLAMRLAAYDPTQVRTVAYVPNFAKGPAALVALACDHVVMGESAMLGGKPRTDETTAVDILKEPLQELGQQIDRDWSMLQALADPKHGLGLWTHRATGQLRLMSTQQRDELPAEDQANWTLLRELNTADGLRGTDAESMFVARYLVADYPQLLSLYQVSEEPIALSPTLTDRWVQGLARFLTSPWVTAWLLFGAMFFLMTEMSTPGVGVPGFLGTLCLLLFFWSQSCNGNVHWLEILLFVVGIVFVALELFILPGTGIFGLGGIGMIFVAIVLATQTFIIPRTAEEMARLPVSLSMVFAAIAGFMVSVVLFRKYLAHMPVFKRLMLRSPGSDESLHDIDHRESLVHWSHLVGQEGKTVTPLVPAGKAKFGAEVVDVVSEGQMVDPNQAVVVLQVSGNRVVVRPTQD
jgi:membrane-bound ClpP family serine protease